jgi:hypothetical protein
MTSKGEEFLSLNTLSFLHIQTDKIKASAPILISLLNFAITTMKPVTENIGNTMGWIEIGSYLDD